MYGKVFVTCGVFSTRWNKLSPHNVAVCTRKPHTPSPQRTRSTALKSWAPSARTGVPEGELEVGVSPPLTPRCLRHLYEGGAGVITTSAQGTSAIVTTAGALARAAQAERKRSDDVTLRSSHGYAKSSSSGAAADEIMPRAQLWLPRRMATGMRHQWQVLWHQVLCAV